MKNNWYVITGAPSSGKTTLLERMEKNGRNVFYEWARIYIDQEMKKGKTIQEIRKDELAFQKKILSLKIKFEKKLDPDKQVFMERGIPDSTAYMKMCGIEHDTALSNALKNCFYKKIFLLEIVKFEKDYARTENEEEALRIDTLLADSYQNIGLEVIRVPRISVEAREKFILDNL